MIKENNSNDIPSYLKALIDAGAEIYEVGGPVRDKLMGTEIKDHDLLCRHLKINKTCDILAKFGKVAQVGKSFGIIKFSPRDTKDFNIDIALPRREISTGAGHREFEVDFDPEISVEDDLGRRDFTINAMAISIMDNKLIDPFGGRKDLEKKILRQVFPKAFEEDPLRLLRAVQFAARFGLTIEKETWEAMCSHAKLIETVSGERISIELLKLLTAPRPSVGFDLMLKSGILKYVLPEIYALKGIEQDKQPGDDVYSHTMRALDAGRIDDAIEQRGDPELLIAILFHDIGKVKTARYHAPSKRVVFFSHQIVSVKMAKRIFERLKLSSTGLNTDNILRMIREHMFETKASFTDKAIRRFVAKIGPDIIFKLMDLRLADNRGGKHPSGIKGVLRLRQRIHEEMAKKPPFGPKDLAVSGHDLIDMGIPEGRQIGVILNALVEEVLDEPELNVKETLLELAKKLLNTQEVQKNSKGNNKGEHCEKTKQGGEARSKG